MKTKGKITGILLFTALLLGVIYLSLFTDSGVKNKIELIEVTGNNLLSRDSYLKFSKLNNIYDYKFLSLNLIKERFEKHPFVEKAEVKFKGKNEVLVELTEKKFEGIILKDSIQFLITENFQLIPIVSTIKNLDIPVITNPYLGKKLISFNILKDDETKAAFKIIETAKLVSSDLYSNLSEVNLRNGKDIILSFKGFDFQVIIGRGNEVAKVFYFKEIWNKIHNKQSSELAINYVDLRFEKLIYVGTADTLDVEKGV
ncbi:MAG: FtsQ-type POTRA domain-containing protein [Ignavibacteriales bacterium]|nr:FtsQ-type POTRA domain-containing protein [Ignavibacteriales bacterium]